MTAENILKIAVFEGDGIGPEAMAPCLDPRGMVTDRIGGDRGTSAISAATMAQIDRACDEVQQETRR